jgi:hypothetical protein
MATSRERELRAIEEAHRAAQARIGVAGAYLAMYDWGAVSTVDPGGTSSSWVNRSLRMINAIRRKSTRLAVSYIRLVRALETGYTLGYPEYSDDPKALTMGVLRQQFTELLEEIAAITTEPTSAENADEQWFEAELRRIDDAPARPNRIVMADTTIDDQIKEFLDASSDNDADKVTVEDFTWTADMTPDQIEKSFQKFLEEDVIKPADKRADLIRKSDLTPKQVMARIEKNHEAAGSTGGGLVDHYGISGGRQVLDQVIRRDRRVKVYARGTRPGCCAFCAMLAANGWYYRTKSGALTTSKTTSRTGQDMSPEMENGIRLYHPNCKCFVIVRYVDSSELPETNAAFQKAWNENIRNKFSYTTGKDGKGKNNAYNAWRKWLNQERRKDSTYNPKNR